MHRPEPGFAYTHPRGIFARGWSWGRRGTVDIRTGVSVYKHTPGYVHAEAAGVQKQRELALLSSRWSLTFSRLVFTPPWGNKRSTPANTHPPLGEDSPGGELAPLLTLEVQFLAREMHTRGRACIHSGVSLRIFFHGYHSHRERFLKNNNRPRKSASKNKKSDGWKSIYYHFK